MNTQPVVKLRSLHALLEQRLRDEQKKRQPNGFTVQALKRRKLQVKDQITRVGEVLRAG